MRILHVTPAYFPAVRYGGPIVAVHALCRELAARGHDVEVMTTNVDGPGDSDVPLDGAVCRDGVRVRYFASNHLRRIFWAPSMRGALRRDIETFDVVHLHTIYQWPVWAAGRDARGRGVPYVISPRGMLVQDLIRRRSRLAKTLWIALLERRTIEGAAAIHATSDIEAAELRRFGWRLPPVAVVPNGVDDPAPVSASQRVSLDVTQAVADLPVVLYFGRLSWKKGLDRLLHAFARTAAGTLVLAGTDDEGQGARLAALAEELRIARRIRILSRTIDGVDKERLFAAARVLVLPSYSENFGNTVLEAMRRGVPVVTTPEVGAAEIVRAAQAGFVADGAPESLSAAIACLVGDPELARTMGTAGRRHVARRYTWPRIAERMEALYMGLKQ